MTEYQIQANTRRCAMTGRELQPGERFYSVLFDQSGQFLRQDYSREAWPGTPEGAFSFWTGTVPPLDGPRRPRFDDDLLLDCFHRLEGQTEPDAFLTLNGQIIDVKEDGSFVYTYTLQTSGWNDLNFVAEDAAGNKTKVTKRVEYK